MPTARRIVVVGGMLAFGAAVVAGGDHERLSCPVTTLVAPPGPGGVAAEAGTGCGGETLVDVMLVYTPAARSAAGGEAAILELIDAHVAYTNATYEASGVLHRLRLVEAAEIDYATSGSIITDVVRLRDVDDGHADEVHPLRDAAGADLVCMIVDSTQAGTAFQMLELSTSFASSAFAVISVIATNVVYAHEAGHNMGCGHNNGPGAPDSMFCYSYGHRTPGAEFRTVMSDPPGERVDFYSSPELVFEGLPLGVPGAGCPTDAADCVRSLNEAASTVAMFRPTMVPPACLGDANGDGTVDVSDLLLVILNWGPCPGPPGCPGDLDGDGHVGVPDLTEVLLHWS